MIPFPYQAGGAGRVGADGDPYWSNVSLLLHCDGADGSASILDSSSSPKTITVNGTAQIKTSSVKYGSGAFSSPTDASSSIDVPNQAFGTGDFTVEFWDYHQSGVSPLIVDNRLVTPTASFIIYVSGTNVLSFYAAGANRATSSTLTTNTYYHVAVSRVAGVSRFFVGGVQQGSNYTDANNYDHTTLRFGNNYVNGNSLGANGRLDDIRVTLGVGRYSANFTPPAAAFLNS